jgi:hypothetical protein
MFPIMSGTIGLATNACRGRVQRVFTLTIFPPMEVAAFVLANSSKTDPRNCSNLELRRRFPLRTLRA